MKFCENIIKIKLNKKTFVLIICLLSKGYNILGAVLGEHCQYRPYHIPCQLPSTRCPRKTGICECDPKYPIPALSAGGCLDYRKLGQNCLIDIQCQQIKNAVCLDSKPVNRVTLQVYHNNNINPIKGYVSYEGRCQCKKGYQQTADKCYLKTFNNLNCSGAYQCMEADLNSHCDKKSGRCYCDPGYVYNTDKNECQLIAKKFGDICKLDSECHNWDQNMECSNSQCFCKKGYAINSETQICKLYSESEINSKSHLCSVGFTYDESSGDCQPIQYLLRVRPGESYRFLSMDKFLEMIVIVIFCCVTIAFLRFWRYILPQHIVETQTGMFSDLSHTNRVHRRSRTSRSNSLSRRGRVIQLRVNLESPEETENQSNDMFVSLPLTASYTSLPPYELANNLPTINTDNQPPPYGDEPPTYDEAMALFSAQK